jgi:hypothetical protein
MRRRRYQTLPLAAKDIPMTVHPIGTIACLYMHHFPQDVVAEVEPGPTIAPPHPQP